MARDSTLMKVKYRDRQVVKTNAVYEPNRLVAVSLGFGPKLSLEMVAVERPQRSTKCIRTINELYHER